MYLLGMRHWNSIVLLALLFLTLFRAQALGEGREVFADIGGVVTGPQGEPLSGATVVVVELSVWTTTGQDGRFVFRGLKPGTYHLDVFMMGYAGVTRKTGLTEQGTSVRISLKDSPLQLDEAVVTATRSGVMEREASLNIAQVHRSYLSENPGMTLSQSLKRIPGLQSMDAGTAVSKPVIRGLGFNRIVVAENNLKQQGQQWGADHGLEIDPFSIERIEVTKGPAALMFGSDAIGGAINIKPPALPQEDGLESETQLTGRSNNRLWGFSQLLLLSRNGRFVRARASLRDYADYRVPADSFTYNNWVMPIENKHLVNTGGRDRSGSVAAGVRKEWGVSTLSLSSYNQLIGFFPGAHGIPDPSTLTGVEGRRRPGYPRQKINHFKAMSNTMLLLGGPWLEIDLGYQQNHRREFNPPHVHGAGPLPESDLELELRLHTLSANLKMHHDTGPGNSWLLGLAGNYQRNTHGGYAFLLPAFSYADAGAFALYRLSLSQSLMVHTGVRADMAGVDIEGYLEPVWEDAQTIAHYRERSPRLKAMYANATGQLGVSWCPSGGWNIKANLGSSYRNPTPVELSANGMHHGSLRHEKGDPDLDSERALQLDASLVLDRRTLYLALSPFVNYFTNYLFLNPTGRFSSLPGAGQVYRFSQARALHLGGEVFGQWEVSPALQATLGGEWVWAQNLGSQYPLPFTPPAVLTAGLTYRPQWLFLQPVNTRLLAGIRKAAPQHRVARNEPATQGYTLFDLGVIAHIPWGATRLTLSLNIQNLFDTRYQDHLSFYRKLELPEPGRNLQLGIRIPLSMHLFNEQ